MKQLFVDVHYLIPAVTMVFALKYRQVCISHRRKHTTCEAGDCAVYTYSVTAASSFMGKLQPFSYEARTEAC